jgi:GTP-binding protein HflX
MRVVMNKIDKLGAEELEELRRQWPDAWFSSAHDPADVIRVRDALVAFFEEDYVESDLFVPWTAQRLVAEMHEVGRVLEERYGEDGVTVRLLADAPTLARLRSALADGS